MLYSRFLIVAVIVLYAFSAFSGRLHDLARAGRWDEVFSALYKGAEINERDSNGKTLVDIASKANNEWAVGELVRMGGESGLNDTTLESEMSIQEPSPMEGHTVERRRDRTADESGFLDDSDAWPRSMITPAETFPPPRTPIAPPEEDSVTKNLALQFESLRGLE